MATNVVQSVLELLAPPGLAELGPGPRQGIQPEPILSQKVRAILAPRTVPAQNLALIRALVLLWHDHHHAAHLIAQESETADGAFVHGMVHRREPDYWNSKYWFRRTGKHRAFSAIFERVSELLGNTGSASAPTRDRLLRTGEWDPYGFVDACEAVAGKGNTDPEVKLLCEVQKIETEALIASLCP